MLPIVKVSRFPCKVIQILYIRWSSAVNFDSNMNQWSKDRKAFIRLEA